MTDSLQSKEIARAETAPANESERAAFESHFSPIEDCAKDSSGFYYLDGFVQHHWETWQARAALDAKNDSPLKWENKAVCAASASLDKPPADSTELPNKLSGCHALIEKVAEAICCVKVNIGDGFGPAAVVVGKRFCLEAAQAAIAAIQSELRSALYPGGCKHPQQGEWEWMIDEVKRMREMVTDCNRLDDQ